MFFCKNDDNMLYIKVDDNDKLIYHCKLCEEEYNVNDLNKNSKNINCVYKQNYRTTNYSYKTFINNNIFLDPTLPRIKNIKCPYEDCESNTKNEKKEVIYIKYNSKDLEFIYCCTLCQKKWTSANTKLD